MPDGGSGGKGGDVYFRASQNISSLYSLRRAHFFGNPGKHGKGNKRDGLAGKDLIYNVPVGTEVIEVKKSRYDDRKIRPKEELKFKVADLDEHGSTFMVAKGGKGGVGNGKVS